MATQKEYENKLRQLVQYIEQDGHEKAEEIDVLAEEEYHLEKKKYIEGRIGAVKKYYDNLEKKFQQQMVLDISKTKGQSYRNVLNARNFVVEDVLTTVRDRFSNLDYAENQCLLKKVLFDLTLQGLLQIMEHKLILEVRKADVPMMKNVITQAQNIFHTLTGMNIVLSVDENNFLPDKEKVGVVMHTKTKTASINNTLDKKLEQMGDKLLPHIRQTLFGSNPNRKHSD